MLGKKWTYEEINILQDNYPTSSKDVLLDMLPDRTVNSILIKANKLGLVKEYSADENQWKDEEIDILKNYYPNTCIEKISRLLPDRSEKSIKAKAERLGIRKKNRKKKYVWSNEDNNLFKKYYSDLTTEELINTFFPELSEKQISDKAYRMRLQKSSDAYWRSRRQQALKTSLKLKGIKKSYQTRVKLSESAIRRYQNHPHPVLGLKRSEETRLKISESKKKLGQWKGKNNPRHKHPLNGELNGRWEGGITSERFKIRNSEEYKQWRASVFERDNYTCQCCGVKHDGIQAHHIYNFSSYEDKRFDINNGITLCKNCHCPTVEGSFHNLYGVRDNNLHQLLEYIKHYRGGELIV